MLFSLATALTRFGFVHLQPSLPFSVLLTTGFLLKEGGKLRFLTLVILLLVFSFWLPKFYMGQNIGYTFFFDSQTREIAHKVSKLTDENEKIFVLGAQPIIYYLSDRLPAGEIFTVNLPWNMIVAEENGLNRLREDKPKVVVRDISSSIDGVKVIDFTASINEYISEFYIRQDEVGTTEILVLR